MATEIVPAPERAENTGTVPTRLPDLAAALKSGDRQAVARIFSELADEFLALTDVVLPGSLLWDLGRLHETFHGLALEMGADR